MKYAPLAILAMLFVLGCAQPPAEEEPAPKPVTDAEREARVDAALEPAALGMKAAAAGRSLGLGTFLKDGADYEPRVARYVIARLEKRLLAAEVSVIERRNLDKVFEELKFQQSDLVDQDTRVEVGNIAGIEVMVLGVISETSLTVYRVDMKVVEMESGRVLTTIAADIDRRDLPVKYGGK